MKRYSPNPTRRHGSASLAALVVCLAGSIGLLGMISIMQARHSVIEASGDKAARRVRLLNGRQLAKEAVFSRVLASETGSATTLALDGNWGRVTVPAWTSNPYTTDQISSISNQVAPSPDLPAYSTSITASIYTVVNESSTWSSPESFTCLINAQNTALAGYLLDARRPADSGARNTVTGDIVVNGKALVFENPAQNNEFVFEANSVNAFTSSLDRSNFDVDVPTRPDNFPMLPLPEGISTAGYVKGDRTGVDLAGSAALELIAIALSTGQTVQAESAIQANGIDSDGSGTVNVTLGNFGLVHTVLQGTLTTLNLIGQPNAAEAMAVENLAPVILITNSTSLTTVNFSALNRRPLILAHVASEASSSQVISYVLPSGANFRVFLVQQDANTQFSLAGNAVIRGGLALDFNTTVSGGILRIEAETTKSFFQALLPRSAWLETYRQL